PAGGVRNVDRQDAGVPRAGIPWRRAHARPACDTASLRLRELLGMRLRARPSNKCGLLPLPKGEGWGEGVHTIESPTTLTPTLSPAGRGSPAVPRWKAVPCVTTTEDQKCAA